jgi:hypothetical protein
MKLSLHMVFLQAIKLDAMIISGELIDACSMSAVQTPVKEAWCMADELAEQGKLSVNEQDKLLFLLSDDIRKQLETTEFDDFDLIYEYFLQLIDNK